GETLTFVRCGSHKDRPLQADNLHLDIWHRGENVLFDGGSYKYNTDPSTIKYFMGTASHNSVMLGDYDQMEKGARFIWYHWTQAIKAQVEEQADSYIFEGDISAFRQINSKIIHSRKITKLKGKSVWRIEDTIRNKPGDLEMVQLWHGGQMIHISSKDQDAQPLIVKKEKGWKSDYYGIKQQADQYKVTTSNNKIITEIRL